MNERDAHTEQPSPRVRKAIATGGTTGIGRAIAALLASEGVDVFARGRDPQHLADAPARIAEVGHGPGAVDLAEPLTSGAICSATRRCCAPRGYRGPRALSPHPVAWMQDKE